MVFVARRRAIADRSPSREPPGILRPALGGTTVNGRGMTDYDLPTATDERAPFLVRRCLAYAAACLHRAQEDFGDTAMKSYISFSFADTDEAPLTSNITFCTPLPDVRPYIPDLESVKDAAVAELSAEDCSPWS